MSLADEITKICFQHYEKLPKNGKPNAHEWTILSAIVVETSQNKFKVLSIATGSKCLPLSALSTNGNLIHDSHAEILARRGFMRYVYEELNSLFGNSSHKSDLFVLSQDKKSNEFSTVKCKSNTKLYLFSSHTPCGDCSIIPKAASIKLAQDNDDFVGPLSKKTKIDDIHRTGAKCVTSSLIQDTHEEGINYHKIRAVRTKPGRGPPSISMSCSDKLCKWLVVGLQGSLLSNFLDKPIYLDGIIISKCPYDREAMERGLFERASDVKDLPAKYLCTKPTLLQSNLIFEDSKQARLTKNPNSLFNACPTSICWSNLEKNPSCVLVRGNLLGMTQKASKSKKQPAMSKNEFLKNFLKLSKKKDSISYDDAKLINKSFNKACNRFHQSEIFSNWIRIDKNKYYQFKIE